MATNNIKIFDQNKANMLTDEAYNTSTQRLNGVQQGIASSQLQNKTLYQVSLVAYAIGQMMQANGLNANDADAVSTFAGNLSSTIVQKILDKASTTEAKNFTVNNKFITPQTWKAAYDFMKADSNMVTSAVDDTHYITPKLLKEGAEKYGDKVRLDDGSLAQWKTFSKLIIPKNFANINDELSSNYSLYVYDKLKRYIITLRSQDSNSKLELFDYNTGKKLDTATALNFNNKTYTITRYYYQFSTNSFLILGLESSRYSVLAVSFENSQFKILNTYLLGGSSASYGIYTNYCEVGKFYDDKIYAFFTVQASKNSAMHILHYNIQNNTFAEDKVANVGSSYISYFGISESGIPCFMYSDNYANLTLYVLKDGAVNTYSLGGSEYNKIKFAIKNDYAYFSTKSGLKKINLANGTITNLGFSVSGSTGFMIISDDDNGAFFDGVQYGSPDSKLSINEIVKTNIGLKDDVILSRYGMSVKYMKYKDKVLCDTGINFLFDIEYAYFGAPVTEIPEST